MKLYDFLNKFNLDKERIITYSGEYALKAVERNGNALQYVDPNVFEN